jgi:hypothetical protein
MQAATADSGALVFLGDEPHPPIAALSTTTHLILFITFSK